MNNSSVKTKAIKIIDKLSDEDESLNESSNSNDARINDEDIDMEEILASYLNSSQQNIDSNYKNLEFSGFMTIGEPNPSDPFRDFEVVHFMLFVD